VKKVLGSGFWVLGVMTIEVNIRGKNVAAGFSLRGHKLEACLTKFL
jgi:hypothetical protein